MDFPVISFSPWRWWWWWWWVFVANGFMAQSIQASSSSSPDHTLFFGGDEDYDYDPMAFSTGMNCPRRQSEQGPGWLECVEPLINEQFNQLITFEVV